MGGKVTIPSHASVLPHASAESIMQAETKSDSGLSHLHARVRQRVAWQRMRQRGYSEK